MRKKTRFIFLAAGMVFLFLLSGCGGDGGDPEKKETVTVAFWSDQLTENYGSYLQETFPEVDFVFYVATNSTDFYRFKEENGDLPDILTVRRFSLSDMASWRDSLLDLSDSWLANQFPQTYLRSYTYSDGAVNWLPACAEVDSIIVNRSLLEEHGLSVPENYGEFVETCADLREAGIRPFLTNFEADYTCMEILQGLSIPQLTSQAGREWRQRYESGQTFQLSEEVWLPVFERLKEFLADTGITAADLDIRHNEVIEAYENGQLAMIRGTGNEDAIRNSKNGESLLMPYFGETEDENWYLTYPAFQAAASVRAEESPERKQLILDILGAMLNGEGQIRIASGKNMIPYSRDVELGLSEELKHIRPYIEENRLYIRLASSDMFSVSREVVQGMITGKYPDAQSAFDAFNKAMRRSSGEFPQAAYVDTAYSYAFRPRGGSRAASAVMNSLREELGAELLIGQSVNTAGNIASGGYTGEELRFLTMGEGVALLQCRLTGDQLYGYLDAVLNTPGQRGSVMNDSSLYVSSGFEMEVKKTDGGYRLEKLTAGGKELDRTSTYSLTVLGDEAFHGRLLAGCGAEDCTKLPDVYEEIIADRLRAGGQLAEPTDYITLT